MQYKHAEKVRPMERINMPKGKSFSMKTDAGGAISAEVAMHLSSSLYRDKIGAVIREISCNAYDAHVTVKQQQRPFLLHLPNRLEPFFRVRDYGPGLSDNDMERVYTTYFASTKQSNNEETGGWGLGSKSPFAYTDSFTIVSYFKGKATTFVASKDENQRPNLAKMGSTKTTEESGLEVTVPVTNQNDFVEFRRKARNILSIFATRPIVVGSPEFSFREDEIEFQGDGWYTIVKENSYSYSSDRQSYALMANVAYPILADDNGGLSEQAKRVYDCGIYVTFPNGELAPTLGREDLSYNPPTKQILNERAAQIEAEASTVIATKFETCTTMFEALKLYGELFDNKYGGLSNLTKQLITFKGTKIESAFFGIEGKKYKETDFILFDSKGSRRDTPTRKDVSGDNFSIKADSKNAIFIDDVGHGALTRVNQVKENYRVCLYVSGPDEEITEFLKGMNGFPVVYISSIPKPARKPRQKRLISDDNDAKPIPAVLVITEESYVANKSTQWAWDEVKIKPQQGGLYIERRGYQPIYPTGFDHLDKKTDFIGLLLRAYNLDLISGPVYGLRPGNVETFKAKGNWRNVMDVIAEKLKERIKQQDVKNAIFNEGKIIEWRREFGEHYNRISPFEKFKELNKLYRTKLIGDVVDAWTSAQDKDGEQLLLKIRNAYQRFFNRYFEVEYQKGVGIDFHEYWEKIIKKYPLLEIVFNDIKPEKYIVLADYLALIDGQNRP